MTRLLKSPEKVLRWRELTEGRGGRNTVSWLLRCHPLTHVFSWVTDMPSLSSTYETLVCSVQCGGHLPHAVIEM